VSIKKIFRKKFYSAISKYLITLIVTVAFDLTTAIIVGVILSIFSFAIRSAKISINCEHVDVNRMNIDDKTSIVIKENHANTLVVYITGSVFFANCEQLSSSVIPHLQDCSRILFSMRGVPLIDTSGIQAFEDLFIDAKINDVEFYFSGLQPDVDELLTRSDFKEKIGKHNFFKNAEEALIAIAVDNSIQTAN
ncbi:MAG: STAS domain-containing protein, partial [Oscillospiraceae bacterium]